LEGKKEEAVHVPDSARIPLILLLPPFSLLMAQSKFSVVWIQLALFIPANL
jgi:hypothetical protein